MKTDNVEVCQGVISWKITKISIRATFDLNVAYRNRNPLPGATSQVSCKGVLSQVWLFLDTPFPLKLLFLEACFVSFPDFFFRKPFRRWIRFLTARFLLFRGGRRLTGCFVLQIIFLATSFRIKTGLNYCLKFCQNNQKKIPCMLHRRLFRERVRYCSCHSNLKFISSSQRVISSISLIYPVN